MERAITPLLNAMNRQHPTVLIILVNWNGKKDTLECLESLKSISYPSFTSIVIDNGSTDDSVATLRKHFPDTPIFETKENLGFAGGNNVGIAWGLEKGYDWILLLNNDTKVDPHFLHALLNAAKEKPEAKILGPKIYRYHDPNRIDHLGGFWDPNIAEFVSPTQGKFDDEISYETMTQVDYVCGASLFMHRSVPETIGLLEPNFFLFWEETDYCSRARRANFQIWTAPKAKIWHKVSASFTGGKPHTHYFWWRSRLLWIERNCLYAEKKALYRKVIMPDLWKAARHYLLRSFHAIFRHSDPIHQQNTLRLKAGLLGALHYAIGRFGNCPTWLVKKR